MTTDNWQAIPAELRARRQWCVSTLAPLANGKPDKAPRQADGSLADVTNPGTWCTFEEAVASGYPAIGFVLTPADPVAVIDLDYTDNPEIRQSQVQVYEAFAGTYAERSLSGTGCHIITLGSIGGGVRRQGIEVYDQDRYIICTGDVCRNDPLADLNGALHELVQTLGGIDFTLGLPPSEPQQEDDDALLERIRKASNGDRFAALFDNAPAEGDDWSRRDAQLAQFLAFYTRNHEQALRLFRRSRLYRPGGKGGYNTTEKYEQGYLLGRTFRQAWSALEGDRRREQALIDHGRQVWQQIQAGMAAQQEEQLRASSERAKAAPQPEMPSPGDIPPPPGLLGTVASVIYHRSTIPNATIALAGAINMLSGITGRVYLTHTGYGLNQYTLLLANTGTGKEAAKGGPDAIMQAVDRVYQQRVAGIAKPSSMVRGPGRFASGQGLAEAVRDRPSQYVVSAEFGQTLQRLGGSRVPDYILSMLQEMLEVYTANEDGRAYGGKRASDKKNSHEGVAQPSLSMLAESPADRFYDMLDEQFTASGLLPRFLVLEPDTSNMQISYNPIREVPEHVAEQLYDLYAYCAHRRAFDAESTPDHIIVQPDPATGAYDATYAEQCLRYYSELPSGLERDLWTRRRALVLKLAALAAVAVNPWQPQLTMDVYRWAQAVVEQGQARMLSRIQSGAVGTGDDRAQAELIRVMKEWFELPHGKRFRYSREPLIYKKQDHLVPSNYLKKRLRRVKPFIDHRLGANNAIDEAIKHAVDEQIVTEVGQEWKLSNGIDKRYRLLMPGPEFE